MALQVESVVNGGVHAEKPLGGASRLEPLHLVLSSSHRLMRVFGTIVLPQPLLVPAGQPQTPERRDVARPTGTSRSATIATRTKVWLTLRWREMDSKFQFRDASRYWQALGAFIRR
jgi:hypothetical protein